MNCYSAAERSLSLYAERTHAAAVFIKEQKQPKGEGAKVVSPLTKFGPRGRH